MRHVLNIHLTRFTDDAMSLTHARFSPSYGRRICFYLKCAKGLVGSVQQSSLLSLRKCDYWANRTSSRVISLASFGHFTTTDTNPQRYPLEFDRCRNSESQYRTKKWQDRPRGRKTSNGKWCFEPEGRNYTLIRRN